MDQVMHWFDQACVQAPVRWCTQAHGAGEDDGEGPGKGLPHTHGSGVRAPVMSVGGLAGSGKTTIVRSIVGSLGASAVYAAPTHKAAAVLRGRLAEGAEVRTHHSLTYETRMRYYCTLSSRDVRPVPHTCAAGQDGCEHPLKFETPCKPGAEHACRIDAEPLRSALRTVIDGHIGLVVIDESSMLSEQDIEDTRTLGVPVLLVGDHGQLPPVKGVMNPWMREPDALLTHNWRQGEASGIIDAAMRVRTEGRLPVGRYGDAAVVAKINSPEIQGLLNSGRFVPGAGRAVIVPTNRLRAGMNRAFHGHGEVRPGDRVVSLQRCMVIVADRPGATIRNTLGGGSESWVFNGTTGTVREVAALGSGTVMVLVMIEQDHPGGEGRWFLTTAALEQFGRETPLMQNEKPKAAKLWDYAYVMTAHKAQGSEYGDVLVYGEPWADYGRWMYTAVTRARQRLVVAVN